MAAVPLVVMKTLLINSSTITPSSPGSSYSAWEGQGTRNNKAWGPGLGVSDVQGEAPTVAAAAADQTHVGNVRVSVGGIQSDSTVRIVRVIDNTLTPSWKPPRCRCCKERDSGRWWPNADLHTRVGVHQLPELVRGQVVVSKG
eukprot:25736-Prorocentrum_minimum.AAC.10